MTASGTTLGGRATIPSPAGHSTAGAGPALPVIVTCHDCGLRQALELPDGVGQAKCTRCAALMVRRHPGWLDLALACRISSVLLFLAANLTPLMSLDLFGREQHTWIWTGVEAMADRNYWLIAVAILIASMIAPAIKISCSCVMLICLRKEIKPWWLEHVWRAYEFARPWSMPDVYLLGVFVALSKLGALANVTAGTAVFALGGLVLSEAGADWAVDQRTLHDALYPVLGETHAPDLTPRQSFSRTWSLVIAGIIFYIPANLMPVLAVVRLGRGSPSTIVGGVIELVDGAQWPLAIIVFVASIAVPVLKLGGLILLLLTAARQSGWRRRGRTKLYRIIEFIGRWSMVDVFMISILTALVQLGSLANVEPGFGVTYFASVVIVTMFAAMNFDPRTIWRDAKAATDA